MKLKELRKQKQMTQVAVARFVGCSLMSYQLWEKEVSSPNERNHAKLVELFGEEVDG